MANTTTNYYFTACKLPADPGDCKEFLQMWFFDAEMGECEQFDFGGCGGESSWLRRDALAAEVGLRSLILSKII